MIQLTDLDEPTIRDQAISAGFVTVELYIQSLVKQDADRLAVRKGLDDLQAGRHRPLADFDREFREQNGFAPPQ